MAGDPPPLTCAYCGQQYYVNGSHWCPNPYGTNPNWQRDQETLEFMREAKSLLLQIVEKLDLIEKNTRNVTVRISPRS